ncbi:hypothetical protein D8674_016510 [Pyrus ussuriensis x Pyrus communis]|uniref:Uncharacterized protein n=1 Tax=Pyrus ussuriensis x Pyrus communis TaxID=2448454 RepID=A0A5N5HH98_9ROSA|nr:hypothetical protein D8674_016510 [Pyrus ussuriensis x Pyrus communis]
MVICHQHKPHIQILKLLGRGKLSDAVEAADLLIEDEGHVDCVDRGEIGDLEVANGFEVLDGNASSWMAVGLLVELEKDGVKVGVKEEGGERGVGPGLGEEEKGLGFGRGGMKGLDFEV